MKIQKFIFAVLLGSFLSHTIYSQSLPKTYYEAQTGKLKFGVFYPAKIDSAKLYPLIMYLHGFGSNYPVYLNWYDTEVQSVNPCFVYSPRTPKDWGNWSGWWDNLTEPMTVAIHVLDSLVKSYPIDTNRIYVYGISMGGEGTFDLLDKFPGKFAAAMSVCGGGQAHWAENISHTPFWMFHGELDEINTPDLTERVYEELVYIGAKKMRYKSYPGYGHEIWDIAQGEPAWKDWMFAFSKNDTVYEKPTGIIELAGSVSENRVKLIWNDIRIDNQIADKIWYYKVYNKSGLIGTAEFNKTTFEFPLTISADTFKVTGVNYKFQESDASNQVILDNGVILDVEESADFTNSEFGIESIYPNPFNPSTMIKYSTPPQSSPLLKGRKQEGFVTLKVFNILGQEVATLINETQEAGKHEVKFTADNLSSGVYFVKISAGGFNQVKKIMLAK